MAADDRALPPVRLPAGMVVGLHAIVFVALAWSSWLKWPDPLIDFGRELYVPWQILHGAVLYRDLESLFGPLSPYLNALWFRLFGVSLLTLVGVNLAIFAAIVAAVHHLVYLSSDRFTAIAASLVTVGLFGFLQLIGVGNYNFVTPYSHEASHGFALGIALLLVLHAALDRRSVALGAIAGLVFGLVLLTKVEVVAAAAAGTCVAFVSVAALGSDRRRFLRTVVPIFAAAATIPTALFFVHFQRHMDSMTALGAVTRGWLGALEIANTGKTFYLIGSGMDRPMFNAVRLVLIAGALLIYIAAMAAFCSRKAQSLPSVARTAGRVALMMPAAATMWLGFERALPLAALSVFGMMSASFVRNRHDPATAMRWLPCVMWSAFAVALLAKLGLEARIHHYGFYLALPATTLVVVALCWLIPRALVRFEPGKAGQEFRRLAAACILLATVPYVATAIGIYGTKTVAVGLGPDRFFASETDT